MYKAPLKLVRRVLSCPLLMFLSEAFSVTFNLNKIYTKLPVTETVFGPGVKSPLEMTNLAVLFTTKLSTATSNLFFRTQLTSQLPPTKPFSIDPCLIWSLTNNVSLLLNYRVIVLKT